MERINVCPICRSNDVRYSPAAIARFVSWRITGKLENNEASTESISCNNCNFFGCRDRILEEESEKLYQNYRDDAYNNMRIQCEPGYLERKNTFDENLYFQERHNNLKNLISKNMNISEICSVLDYGGDDGKYTKLFNSAEKYVYDIAENTLVDGVSHFNLNENKKFDLIMCCHVLEHVSDPNDIIQTLKKYSHEDTYFYIEVPGYEKPPPEFLIFHEHINVFNIKSIKFLLEMNNLSVIDYSTNNNYICVVGKCV